MFLVQKHICLLSSLDSRYLDPTQVVGSYTHALYPADVHTYVLCHYLGHLYCVFGLVLDACFLSSFGFAADVDIRYYHLSCVTGIGSDTNLD